MNFNLTALTTLAQQLDPVMLARTEQAADKIVEVKKRGGKVVVVTGSGPNIHEGVTTLIAELMRVGIVDGVSTSSAVVAHEMGGALDKVKRCPGVPLGIPAHFLPKGGDFELTVMDDADIDEISRHIAIDHDLIARLKQAEGKTIIKAAGNLGYPMGLWLEHLSLEIAALARERGMSFEEVAGLGADERTMIGIGARRGLPVLVTMPQVVGGALVGICIGDSMTLKDRAVRLARMLGSADVIIESGVALTQEIHDGPFETYTGHGLWSAWQGDFTYRLEGKTLLRIDLDPNLETVCRIEREGREVQAAIADGLPKTKQFKVPFRMEMSGFARHEGSMPLIGDLGVIWPLMAVRIAGRLGLDLQFLSFPQQTAEGKTMREMIVRDIKAISRAKMLAALPTRS